MRRTAALFTAWVMMVGPAADDPKAGEKAALKQLQGVWRPESVTVNGKSRKASTLRRSAA
jgi:hypothetical protein